jgi:hypothetical protein
VHHARCRRHEDLHVLGAQTDPNRQFVRSETTGSGPFHEGRESLFRIFGRTFEWRNRATRFDRRPRIYHHTATDRGDR